MPLLFSLGVHKAPAELGNQLLQDENICVFLDDVYALCSPDRVTVLFEMLRDALKREAGIELNPGKTKVCNRGGRKPPGGPQRIGALRNTGRDT